MVRRSMSSFYDDHHRALQDEFQSRALADRLEAGIVKDTLDDDARSFIGRMPYCFLSTLSESGYPSTSYKGGAPGFVKVQHNKHLLLPCFDGNGMWRSAGNVAGQSKVGLLFIDFESPQRLRIEGTATLTRDPAITRLWPEVAVAMNISVDAAWVNCPRYIPTMQQVAASTDAPEFDRVTPEPDWKSHEALADVVPSRPHRVKSENH